VGALRVIVGGAAVLMVGGAYASYKLSKFGMTASAMALVQSLFD
jgi:hypothetical protein